MNKALLLLATALFTWGIGEGMFFYFQPLYLAELGADPVQIGAILGAAGMAMTLLHIPAGYLADKVGRRPLLWSAWASGLLAAALMAFARTLPVFVAGLVFYSLTTFVVSPLNSYMTAARGKWTVERAITLITAVFSLGMILGPLLGGWVGDAFGMRSIYQVSLGIFAFSTIFIFILPAQPISKTAEQKRSKDLFKNRAYLRFLALIFVIMLVSYLPQPLTQNFLQDVRGLSLKQIGLLGSLAAVGNVVMSLSLGHLKARLGFILGQIFTALFAFLIWQGSGMLVFGLAYFLLGGYRASKSLASAQVGMLVDESQMGLAYGMIETVAAVSLTLAPPLAGYLYAKDPASPYPLSLILIFFGILAALIFFPRPQVRE